MKSMTKNCYIAPSCSNFFSAFRPILRLTFKLSQLQFLWNMKVKTILKMDQY